MFPSQSNVCECATCSLRGFCGVLWLFLPRSFVMEVERPCFIQTSMFSISAKRYKQLLRDSFIQLRNSEISCCDTFNALLVLPPREKVIDWARNPFFPVVENYFIKNLPYCKEHSLIWQLCTKLSLCVCIFGAKRAIRALSSSLIFRSVLECVVGE